MADIEVVKTLIVNRRRVPLDMIPDAAYPVDKQPSDVFRAFSYPGQAVASILAEFMNERFGDVLVWEHTMPSGRVVHLYKVDKVAYAAARQAFRDALRPAVDNARESRRSRVDKRLFV